MSLEQKRTPVSVLEGLTTTTVSEAAGGGELTSDQVVYTREILGMSLPRYTADTAACCSRCPIAEVWPTVIKLDIPPGGGSLKPAIESEINKEIRRCQVCGSSGQRASSDDADSLTSRYDASTTPNSFFVCMGDEGMGLSEFSLEAATLSHWVNVFGETFSLCGVVYRTPGEDVSPQYSFQAYFDGGWWTYRGNRLVNNMNFEDYLDGMEEHLLLFVRTSIVTSRYGKDASWDASTEEEVGLTTYSDLGMYRTRRSVWLTEGEHACIGTIGT